MAEFDKEHLRIKIYAARLSSYNKYLVVNHRCVINRKYKIDQLKFNNKNNELNDQ